MPTSADSWIKATNPRTGYTGEAPANYVTGEKGYSAALDAFHNVDRTAAETILNSNMYKEAFNYILRPSTGMQKYFPVFRD